MDFIDYYNVLGLTNTATPEEIKKAYRKMARQHHPDLNPNNAEAEKRFKQINEANEVLSNPENRKKYDQYGKDWQHAEQFDQAQRQRNASHGQRSYGSTGGAEDFYSQMGGEEGDFSDFFSSMFGQRGSQRATQFRGQDYHSTLTISLSEAFHTHKQTFTVNGKNIRITVPAGIEQGQEIKLKGHGAPGANGGPNGDLYITFDLHNDTPYLRKGNDLYLDYPLDLYKAVLGGEEIVETLSGKVKMKIAPETQNGTKVRLKGKGFPVYKKEGQYGDLYLTYTLQLPKKLTDKEKELFKQLAQER